MPIIGVAYYLHPHSPIDSPAWAYISGSAIEKTTHPAAIRGVTWFTNLDLSALIEWGLDPSTIKRNDFFPGGLIGLVKESGLSPQNIAKNGEGLDLIHQLISSTMSFIRKLEFCDDISHLHKLGDAIPKTEQKNDTAEYIRQSQLYNQAFIGSYKHTYRSQDPAIMGAGERLVFRFPKGAYAKHLSERPIPTGGWKEIEIGNENPHEFIIKHAQTSAGFVRIRTRKKDADSLRLLSICDHTGQWLTLPEAAEVSLQIPLRIDVAIIGSLGENEIKRTVEVVERASPISLLTFSAGYVLESAWNEMASVRMKRSDNSHSFPCSTASYIRSWDRIACYRAARKLALNGTEVISYGHGQLTLLVPEFDVEAKIVEAYDLGLTANLDTFYKSRKARQEKSKEPMLNVRH